VAVSPRMPRAAHGYVTAVFEEERPGTLSRWVKGRPPVVEPVDRFSRYGFFTAWLLGMFGLVGNLPFLLVPAGSLIAVNGWMLFTNFKGVRDRMRRREERSFSYRVTEQRQATKFGGVLMMVIGTGWFAAGIASAISAL